jgi:hypothetical protein
VLTLPLSFSGAVDDNAFVLIDGTRHFKFNSKPKHQSTSALPTAVVLSIFLMREMKVRELIKMTTRERLAHPRKGGLVHG